MKRLLLLGSVIVVAVGLVVVRYVAEKEPSWSHDRLRSARPATAAKSRPAQVYHQPEPAGHSLCGAFVDNDVPVVNLNVSFSYSWRPGARGSVRHRTSPDSSGMFCFTNQPDCFGTVRWEYAIPGGSIEYARRVNPAGATTCELHLKRDSEIRAKLRKPDGAAPKKGVEGLLVYCVRIQPNSVISNYGRGTMVSLPHARDFRLSKFRRASPKGTFAFDGLPAGTYVIVDPGTGAGRGVRASARPPLFDPVVVLLGTNEQKTIVVTIRQE